MSYKGSTDQPAKIDMFGIGNYISGLSSFIIDCETPMTIAIQGNWGSGKTSVMEMVSASIDKKAVHCVWFNTWQFSQFNTADSLSLSLIEAIIEGLRIEGGESLGKIRGGLGRLGAIMANVGKRALYAGSDMVIGSTNTGDLKNMLENNDEITEAISDLKSRFQACVNDAVEKNKVNRILVFIDDLDRLQPLRAVELLEVLKIFLDCEKCVFVLAIDYNVVVSGVKSKYGADFNASKGRSFFDKIIQVPFKMPVAQYDIYNFVKKTFEDIATVKCEDSDVKNYVSLINSSIGSNPRSMKRLFNSYLLLLKVVGKEALEKDVMSKKTLFAILCMQQHFESLYNYVAMNKEYISAEFFNKLAASDSPGVILKDENIDIEHYDPEAIQTFIQCFNKSLNTTGEETMDEDNVDRLRFLLKSSSITATETKASGAKKRPTFVYKGDTYMTQGANRMNLSNLALRLIGDYAKETDNTAEELMNMINSRISCYTTALKKAGLGQISNRSNPLLGKKDIKELHFSNKDEIVRLGDSELYVSRGWGVGELTVLIELLGYGGRVSSNVREIL